MPMERDQGNRPIRVLIVDDESSFVKIVEHHFQKFQEREFELIWKESVEDALREVRSKDDIDIIVTDYNLPVTNGLEFVLQLNQMDCQIPIVFVTGTRDYKLAVDAMKLGVEDFLVKEDLQESHLPRTIINVLDRVQMRKQLRAVEKRMLIAENRAQAIRELVVTVCHEFNNPLAAIKISADLLQRMLASNESSVLLKSFEKNFQKIELEIKRLRDINFEKINFHDDRAPHL